MNIAGMARNHNLARKIFDASWGKLLHNLSYKERAGRTVVKVDPRGTSQEVDTSLDRDYRASLGRPEETPVEMGPLFSVPRKRWSPGKPRREAGSPLRKLGVFTSTEKLG
jgi:hypothetical protein